MTVTGRLTSARLVVVSLLLIGSGLGAQSLTYSKGQNIAKGMSVVQVQNGKAVVVYPVEGAQAKFVYPMPPR